MRVVLDTNVFISSILFSGEVSSLADLWKDRVFTPLVSKQVLEEYIRVLSYPKFNLKHEEIDYIIKDKFLLYSEPVKVIRRIDLIKDDPEDNKFLSLSASGKADYIVSGDRHILDLKNWKQGHILSVREFLAMLK